MTTIVGIKCSDGIVIGADTQKTLDAYFYSYKELNYKKIFRIKNDILFAGAGNVTYIEKIKEALSERYDNKKNQLNIPETFEKIFKFVYENYPIDKPFQLIFGCKNSKKELNLYQIHSQCNIAEKIDHFYTIGTGNFFARYIINNFLDLDLSIVDAVSLICYVLDEVCKIDLNSGTPINIAYLKSCGISFVEKEKITKIITKINDYLPSLNKYITKFFKEKIFKANGIDSL